MKKILIIILAIINLIIITRLSFLCIYKKDYYNDILYKNTNQILEGMTAPRGRILDISGNILVDNLGVKSIIYNKLNMSLKEELEISKILADVLEIDVTLSQYNLKYYYYLTNKEKVDNLVGDYILKAYSERKITSNQLLLEKLELINDADLQNVNKKAAYFYYLMNNGYSYQDKIIKENVTDEEYILINSLNLDGIRTDITWERIYPYGAVLKDVYGQVSSYTQGVPADKMEYLNKGYKLNDRVGINNLEYIYDDYLKGEKAKYKVEDNKIKLLSSYERGKDLVLSIDIKMQLAVEEILEKEMINAKIAINSKFYNESYIIISNPQNGSIISLIGKKIKEDQSFIDYSYYNAINAYNLGSVVKGATISVGYKNGLIDEDTKIFDSCVRLYGGKDKCSWKNIGMVDDIQALKMSSNYFQYLIAIGLTGKKYSPGIKLKVKEEHFSEYRGVLADYGLGSLTNVDLSKEGTGQKSSDYTADQLLNISVGHYDTYTPISLAQYINTIATGMRRELSLLKYVLNPDGSIFLEKENKVLNKVPIEEKYLARIQAGFNAVNTSGTAYSYTNHKFSSAGKTGTADSYLDTDLDGIVDTLTKTTSYVMYAPYDNPEISVAIISPNISYKNNTSAYRYPINSRVSREITNIILIND
ncbi:MAG: penicillin-binding transpeptidase domain-containing protein [Bacilli bacterium]|nr:penicillin-binding transpeptidase domain-containing protein [Bacilli bacterium]